jgi:hypothetical protein
LVARLGGSALAAKRHEQATIRLAPVDVELMQRSDRF